MHVQSWRRARRLMGSLLLAFGFAARATAAGADEPAFATTPEIMAADGSDPGVIVFPPQGDPDARRPVTVMLHGMCHAPEYECPYFANAVTERSWLVCPRATLTCEGGGPIWSYRKKYDTVERAVQRVKRAHPDRVDDDRRTLVGFSLGALAAMDIAHRGAGRWQTIVLIGAKVFPHARTLRDQGVERLILASGDRDMMRWHMEQESRKLERTGFRSTFMSMGDVGHWFAPDMDGWWQRANAWIDATPTE